ncbi:MAG: DUF305 domain-containing protein [Alphaproteobacteria bacterium]|nr:DUF305 domain-containing protein [Alphaproteobacteria bacterium]MBU2378438.1 DUF305 domain-containing protein [Alphaproteobacteria bacterium]
MTLRRLLIVAALPWLIASCDGGGDPVEQAMRETSTNNQAATVSDGEMSGPEPRSGHAGATDGDQAFAASEAEMHRMMATASGETVDQAYIAKMIAHHQGAVAMAEVALRDSRDADVRRMAQAVIDAQTREIAEMRAWRPAAAP